MFAHGVVAVFVVPALYWPVEAGAAEGCDSQTARPFVLPGEGEVVAPAAGECAAALVAGPVVEGVELGKVECVSVEVQLVARVVGWPVSVEVCWLRSYGGLQEP